MHPVSIVERNGAISVAPIRNLHRHQDGYIAFATERDGEDFRPPAVLANMAIPMAILFTGLTISGTSTRPMWTSTSTG